MSTSYWVNDSGELQEADEDTAQRYGLRPATDDDLHAHNERLANAAVDTKGTLGLIAEGAQRGLAHVQDIARGIDFRPPAIGSDAFGPGGGMPMPTPEAPAVPAGADTFPEATGDDARRRTQMHPVLEGIGTGLVAAPAAAAAAAGASALGGPALLGASALGMGAESLVNAAAQEYDDAWLEQRPMQLTNVAAYTAMFGLGDVVLRGAGKVAKTAIGDVGKQLGIFGEQYATKAPAMAGKNLVAEAQARTARGEARATQSVGAASAKEMAEPFDDAIATMTDRDATVLARDAPDFEPLIAMHSADDITRLNKGLSESLGNHLKKRDVQIASDALKPAQIQAQAQFAGDIMDQALDAARHLQTGGPARLNFGNAGKMISATIEGYSRQLQDAVQPAERFNLLNGMKQELDKRIMAVGRDFGSDATARTQILKILAPIMGENLGKGRVLKGALREGLENVQYFGEAARLQKALNAPWHDLLEHWSKFQQTLMEQTGSSEWGVIGAGRVGMESTDERVMAMITKNPRMLRQMGEHVGGVYDAYQRLIEARQAHGYVEKEGLGELSDSVRNLMEDWNLAHTVGVAKAKAANKLRDPRKWASAALDVGEKLPGVGGLLGAARGASQLFGDLHIAKGTPLNDVWDRALKRYATHPALEDASIHANYSPWMQDALRSRGARIPTPPTSGLGGIGGAAARPTPGAPPSPGGPAPAGTPGFGWGKAAKENGGKVAGAAAAAGAAFSATDASAAEPAPDASTEFPALPPNPQEGPVGMYGDALRSIDQGGAALIRDKASAMLRARVSSGRGAYRAFTGRRSLDDAVDNARSVLQDLQRDPGALVDRLASNVGELGRTHPSVYMAVVGKATTVVAYLAAEAPQRTGQTLLDPEGAAPSLDRSVDFAHKTVGALMPVQAMNDIARLDAPPEEVAAFQQNWGPELWEPLKAELLGQIQRRYDAGRPVDGEKLRQLDALLGMDGQLDPSGSTAVAQQMLAAQEQQPPPAAPGGGGGAPGGKPSGAAPNAFRTRLETAAMENQIG